MLPLLLMELMAEIASSIVPTGFLFTSRKRSPLLKPNREAIRPGSKTINPSEKKDNPNFD
jgi:hypothetical protein